MKGMVWKSLGEATGLSGTTQLDMPDIRDQFLGISFTHHMVVLNKCKTNEERFFYIMQAAVCFWSVSVLEHHINADLYSNQGKLPNNFSKTLPEQLKPSALQVFQDEYLMDFISSSESEDERNFEEKVVADIKNFIMRIGKGFSFIGNQYRLEVGGEEFFVDLLFFNRHLQCLVVFGLKRGKFKPEYAGQLNFYLNVLDEKVRLDKENASIGIVLCKEKNNTVVEFAVKTIDKAMGVATYRTTKEVPKEMKGILPDAVELAKLL
jgi:predicted nuclease of restriction endonuclease-like (RecB) superfamily